MEVLFEMTTNLLGRLDAHDRRLFLRWSLSRDHSRLARGCWKGITGLGSAAFTIGAAIIPLLTGWLPQGTVWRVGLALAISHGIVQIIKRLVVRNRPSTYRPEHSLVADPDRFSFPSGHSASSFAVAAAYATIFPMATAPLIALGMLVGWSRVALGVHYPGDVLAGQLIAVLTVLALTL